MRKLLMCPPHYYNVAFHLQNVHMKMSREVLHNKAQRQWINLYNLLTHDLGCQVILTPPAIGMVDMVFAANAGLVKGNKAVVSNFTAHARKGETIPYKNILDKYGFDTLISNIEFEGQGDALFSHDKSILWMGHGFRSESYSHSKVGEFLDVDMKNIISILLINPKFYHLDTCFCPLDNGHIMFYPKAFTDYGQTEILNRFGKKNCIMVDKEDAENFACNAISLGDDIVLNKASDKLKCELGNFGYKVWENDMSEFLLSGGSTKCSVLHLD